MSEYRILKWAEQKWLEPIDEPIIEYYCCDNCHSEIEKEYEHEIFVDQVTGYTICDDCLEEFRRDWYALDENEINEITCSVTGEKTGNKYIYLEYSGITLSLAEGSKRFKNIHPERFGNKKWAE